jgi:hypothetical protein
MYSSRLKSVLRILEIDSDKPTTTKSVDYLNVFPWSLDLHFFWSILEVMEFCSLLSCSLRTEHGVALWTLLELVDSKIWLSFEYKHCTLLSLDICRVFICSHFYWGLKFMNLRSTSITVVLLKCCLFYRTPGWSVGTFYSFVSYIWLLGCWVLLVIGWFSFRSCLALSLDYWRRQVNVAPWSTSFHSLFELRQFNFRIHMSQTIW